MSAQGAKKENIFLSENFVTAPDEKFGPKTFIFEVKLHIGVQLKQYLRRSVRNHFYMTSLVLGGEGGGGGRAVVGINDKNRLYFFPVLKARKKGPKINIVQGRNRQRY